MSMGDFQEENYDGNFEVKKNVNFSQDKIDEMNSICTVIEEWAVSFREKKLCEKELKDTLRDLGFNKKELEEYKSKCWCGRIFYNNAKWENQAESVYKALGLNFLLNSKNTKTLIGIIKILFKFESDITKNIKTILDVSRKNDKVNKATMEKLNEFKEKIEIDKKNNTKILKEILREGIDEDKEICILSESILQKKCDLGLLLIEQETKILNLESKIEKTKKLFFGTSIILILLLILLIFKVFQIL